jgi:hypothetical protein
MQFTRESASETYHNQPPGIIHQWSRDLGVHQHNVRRVHVTAFEHVLAAKLDDSAIGCASTRSFPSVKLVSEAVEVRLGY